MNDNQTSLEHPVGKGPSLKFDHVSLALGGNRILEGIDFRVLAGTIHCLIGPNGGGKTSLLKALLGQMPHSGTISVCWSQNRIIGYVPQVLDFDRTLPITVNDFMALTCQKRPAFLGFSKEYRSAISTILDKVGLARKRKRILGQLSGGELQRLMLAQALIPDPGLLVLDEPATGLDRKGASYLHNLLQELKQEGTTIFWIHHDLKEVGKLADEVTCINRKLVYSGKPFEVLTTQNILALFSSR